jgi:hypothetical protein
VRILSVQSIKPVTDKELPTKSKLSKPKFNDKIFLQRYFNQFNNFITGQTLMMSPMRPIHGGRVNYPFPTINKPMQGQSWPCLVYD